MISTYMRRRLARARRDDHGAAVVEFALVVPVLFLIIFAVIDFGRALWTLNVLSSGVREGARAAAVESDVTTAASTAKTKTVAYINGILGTSLTTADVTVPAVNTTTPASADYGLIKVSLSVGGSAGFPFTPVTPFASRMGLGNIRFQPNANYRWEKAN
ncbi:TadE/TadG family type IV pilus assembly protein [Roseisolibacter agri]|uniref:TadE-like domain-containing protein n=1 Tax=Roseisolibacter agri TaxID=2014610 RepID=A0AA37QIZ0_9BACT|nr:TadE/TadG family type IV pilus assembly protein [Roseisolibacter agri]GLC26678.1 hypothetical protein rosag_31910 [Roseisolibacter agri]